MCWTPTFNQVDYVERIRRHQIRASVEVLCIFNMCRNSRNGYQNPSLFLRHKALLFLGRLVTRGMKYITYSNVVRKQAYMQLVERRLSVVKYLFHRKEMGGYSRTSVLRTFLS